MDKVSTTKEINNVDNISLTAYRIINIFKLLYEKPASDQEINDNLQDKITNSKPLSKDTIGIYINTLKAIGCNISRPKKNNNYKFELLDHPFKPNINTEEIKALFDIRKFIVSLDDWKLIIKTEKLITSIIKTLDTKKQEEFSYMKSNLFRGYSLNDKFELIDNLEKYCNNKKYVTFYYESAIGNEKLVSLVAEKLHYENDALYLWGFDISNEETRYYRVDKIKKITTLNIILPSYSINPIEIEYKLCGYASEMFNPSITDIIVSETQNEKIILSKINNSFKFFQDILTYGSECVILSPREIQQEHIKRLTMILKFYQGED
jgi:predicted DNA-binding transcriptional regulator YafY